MLLTALIFFLTLSLLVMIHEFGHFFTAKKFGIKVEEFGFGLPPRIWGKKIGETLYSINALPFGGFVRLFGEDDTGDLKNKKKKESKMSSRAFFTRPVHQRFLVVIAGVVMNFILGVAVISYLFTRGVMVPVDRVHIEKIVAGSPAETAGLMEGDIIRKLKSQNAKVKSQNNSEEEVIVKRGEDVTKFTKERLGEEIILTVERQGKELSVSITPRKDYPKDEGPMGIAISNFEEKKYAWWEAPIFGTKEALVLSFALVKGIVVTIGKLISFQSVSKDIAGPIGVYQMTGEAIKFGKSAVLELIGLLSLNLAIVNILPIPALDGGRLLFIVIEGITGKRIKTTWERYIHQIGMAILLGLILLITLNDVVRVLGK